MSWIKSLSRIASLGLAISLVIEAPGQSWAAITNVASVTYSDAASVNYGPTSSNSVSTLTPPVISGATTATGSIGLPFSGYTITASNSPTGFTAVGLPPGLAINGTTGVISGTPTAAGSFSTTLTASNAAGASPAFTLAFSINGTPSLQLTKSADRASAITGNVITYSLQCRNTGTGDAANVVVRDTVPSGTTLVAGSISNGGTNSNGNLMWSLGAVIAGTTSATVTFQVMVN